MECHENELLEQIRKLVREDKFEQANKVLTSFQLTKFKQEAEKIIIQKCKWYLDEYTKIPRNPAIFLKVGDRSNENTEIRNECSEVGIDIPE
ncbi:hypothetical protein ACN4EK_14355 [Pantanalinema rosaneae CENA516]|uniref:hypothetical protein n=1 Tax=Pantanalinema rosaneae TaxID=1620701 RepID=UPI003D6E39FD